jgi:acetyl/propionyl-CoA carboxylase alpha subunit
MRHAFVLQDIEHLIWLSPKSAGGYRLEIDGRQSDVSIDTGGVLTVDGKQTDARVALDGDRIHVHVDGEAYELVYRDPISRFAQSRDLAQDRVMRAPMPGAVVAMNVAAGQAVAEGETLMIIESMKLETSIRSPRDGIVEIVHLALGQAFERDTLLITLAEA